MISLREMTYCFAIRPFEFWDGLEKGTFPLGVVGLEDPGKIGMHANCGTHSLIVYLRERMKKATVAAKRRKCGVGGRIIEGKGREENKTRRNYK
jgi:hypothetical protein